MNVYVADLRGELSGYVIFAAKDPAEATTFLSEFVKEEYAWTHEEKDFIFNIFSVPNAVAEANIPKVLVNSIEFL